MLRAGIQVFACLCLAAAVALTIFYPGAWPALICAGLLAVGVFHEHLLYRSGKAPRGGTWQPTAERFRDDESGALVTVWFNPVTGERRYVDQGGAPPA